MRNDPDQSTAVTESAPGSILIRSQALTVLRAVLASALPLEGCALLLGEPVAPVNADPRECGLCWRLQWIWPCLNVWLPLSERRRRFAIDPREQLLAQRWCRDRRLQVLGSAHSHPHSQPRPSATDLSLAFIPTLQLILSPQQDWLPHCWWLEGTPDGATTARPLPWTMED
jgi:proteasome lid subunit RPN8/RPN11